MTTSVPSVRDIQQILVEVGDKSKSHVGSRDWIGTYEACMVMDHLYWVCGSILNIMDALRMVILQRAIENTHSYIIILLYYCFLYSPDCVQDNPHAPGC